MELRAEQSSREAERGTVLEGEAGQSMEMRERCGEEVEAQAVRARRRSHCCEPWARSEGGCDERQRRWDRGGVDWRTDSNGLERKTSGM